MAYPCLWQLPIASSNYNYYNYNEELNTATNTAPLLDRSRDELCSLDDKNLACKSTTPISTSA